MYLINHIIFEIFKTRIIKTSRLELIKVLNT